MTTTATQPKTFYFNTGVSITSNSYLAKGDINILDNEYFLKEFNITGEPVYKSTIADVKITDNQIELLNKYLFALFFYFIINNPFFKIKN